MIAKPSFAPTPPPPKPPSLSSTYFFAFFLFTAYPNSALAPFGSAYVSLVFTHSIPRLVMRCVPQPRSSCSPPAAVGTSAALALLCLCISLALPPAITLSAYITLHFAAQSLLRAVGRLRNPQRFDSSDHTLHLVSALAGVAYACCSAPPPDHSQLLPLALLCLLLLLRVLLHQFPF